MADKDPKARHDVARRKRFAERIPGVAWVTRFFARIAGYHVARVPVGLLLLLPFALALDVFDAVDEIFGPVGMGLAFLLESAFLVGVTRHAGFALGGAAVDLVPGVDALPLATLTVIGAIARDLIKTLDDVDAAKSEAPR